jgi:hemerythrin
VDEIDTQHRDFVKLINRIQMAHTERYSSDLKNRMAWELWNYAQYHFFSEENLMMLIKYPDLALQQEEHQKLLDLLRGKVKEVEKGQGDLTSLIEFVFHWFKNHTLQLDKKIGEYMQHLLRAQ